MKRCPFYVLSCLVWTIALVGCGGVSTKEVQISPTQAVAAEKAALVLGYAAGDSASSVTQNLTLPTSGVDSTTVAWTSSNPTVISTTGVVTQPLTGDVNVTLTATIADGTTSDIKAFLVTVKAQMTDAQAVAAAKAALAIGYASGDSATGVTQNLTLASSGIDGSTITWVSSNPLVVTIAGVVARPVTSDASVNLTATITVGSASDTRLFPVVVKAQMTDAQAVAAAKAALAVGYASGDSASAVTQNVTLPAAGLYGSAITWSTSNPGVVATDGTVTQPVTGDAGVTLTATIVLASASDTKLFPIVVKAQMTDAQAVAAAKSVLAIGYASGDAATSVTQNLSLPVTGTAGCTVSWTSSDPSIVAVDGTVSRPVTGDVPVTLTATIALNAASDQKAFIVTVKAQMTDAEAVAAAKAALQIGYAEGDSAAAVTQNVTLPASGSSSCAISWASSNASVVSTTGTVVRPEIGDAAVTLTATISSHAASDTAQFPITVKGQISDQAAVAAAKAALDIVYADGDSSTSVTQNVGLPLTGVDNCTVSWASDSPDVISISGTVAEPCCEPATVTLTATISSNGASDTKLFPLTVQPVMSDAAAVAADKAAIQIVYGPGDDATNVNGNFVLPTSGTNGSSITWSSSVPEVVSISGGVTVPSDQDVPVTMTATITRGTATDTRDFFLTVKARPLDAWYNSSAISPGENAIEVDPGIVVRIPFDVHLDPATVTSDTFQLSQTSNSQNVPAVVTCDAACETVSMTPLAPLQEGTGYSATVSTNVQDIQGNKLPGGIAFNFTTLSYADILAQWKFNGDGNDASGKGNTVTAISGSFDTSVVHEGTASLYLDGTGQDGTSNINLGTQLTVTVWVNVDNPIQASINTVMANAGPQEETNGFKLCINRWGTSDQSVVIEVGDGNTGGKWVTAPGLIQPGSWYHLAFVIDQPNQAMRIYYNGASAPLQFVSDEGFTVDQFNYDFNTAGPFTIGSFPSEMEGLPGFWGLKGHLDDMRVYNRVLTDDEIAKIAQEN
ncbi:MAG TPA: immunoglobulin-like domain-containing protein [Candidatus Sulfotelmatobacter sp.]|nr:immunoglobulin-like domain-containing protein [Candidatus Sulfotelmatobacter sp.]